MLICFDGVREKLVQPWTVQPLIPLGMKLALNSRTNLEAVGANRVP
jgi:hypothetical protein